MPRAPQIAVVGFPNVGKSTLVNRLAGGREAVVHEEAGVTRDRKAVACEWNGVRFDLIDTGGVDLEAERLALAGGPGPGARGDRRRRRRRARRRRARRPAPGDAEVAEILRRGSESRWWSSPTRSTSRATTTWRADFHRLGLGEPFPVSAAQGHGTGDLLDRLAEWARAPRRRRPPDAEAEIRGSRSSGGRTSASRRSSTRSWAPERVIVSELAGTTRDAIDTELEFGDRPLVLVDTAGLRRRTKVAGTVAYYAQLRSERAAERADVAIVVCDASEGVTSEDLRVAELAMRTGCATLVALNKWDVGARPTSTTRPRGSPSGFASARR